jgi:hypothetical protein
MLMQRGRGHRNRRLGRPNVLDVRLRTREVRAARVRLLVSALALAVAALTVAFGMWRAGEWVLEQMVFQNPAFGLRQLEIESGHLPAGWVQAWAGVRSGENLIRLDLDRVRRNLELVPVIRSVSVHRVFPSKLRIRVVARRPVAQFEAPQMVPGGGVKLVTYHLDEEGVVMRLPPMGEQALSGGNGPRVLPRLLGVVTGNLVVGRVLEGGDVAGALALIDRFGGSPMGGLTSLVSLDLAQPGFLEVLTADGNRITFGAHDLERQFWRWRRVHDYAAARGQVISTLDLSVTNNVPAVLTDERLPAAGALPGAERTRA